MPKPARSDFLTASQVAELLGVTKQRVAVWCRDERIPAQRHGRLWMIRRKDARRPKPKIGGRKRRQTAPGE